MKTHPIALKVIALCTAMVTTIGGAMAFLRALFHLLIAAMGRMEAQQRQINANSDEIAALRIEGLRKDGEIAELNQRIAALTVQNAGQQEQLDTLNSRLVVVTRERDAAIARADALEKLQGR